MKKALVCATGIVCLLAVFAFAAEKPSARSTQSVLPKTATMNARGKVVEISEKAVRIERSIKGNAEVMEFALENPAADIAVNDFQNRLHDQRRQIDRLQGGQTKGGKKL